MCPAVRSRTHLRHDDLALGIRRRGLDLVHEAVVAHTVLDDELRPTYLFGDRRAGFEGVGSVLGLSRIDDDRHVLPADLG